MNVKELVYRQVKKQLRAKSHAEIDIEESKKTIKIQEEKIQNIDQFINEASEMFGLKVSILTGDDGSKKLKLNDADDVYWFDL